MFSSLHPDLVLERSEIRTPDRASARRLLPVWPICAAPGLGVPAGDRQPRAWRRGGVPPNAAGEVLRELEALG